MLIVNPEGWVQASQKAKLTDADDKVVPWHADTDSFWKLTCSSSRFLLLVCASDTCKQQSRCPANPIKGDKNQTTRQVSNPMLKSTAQVSLYQKGVEIHCGEFFVHLCKSKDEFSAPTFMFPNHLFVCLEKFEVLVVKCKNLNVAKKSKIDEEKL